MNKGEAWRVMAGAEQLYSCEAVEHAIRRLGKEITEALKETDPVVLCVMNGGLIFCGQLLTRLNFPLEVGYLHASRYGDATCGGTLEWVIRPRIELTGRTVLLVDDILDEGVTLEELCQTCRDAGAAEVHTAVLVDKRHDRKVSPGYKADFTGLEIDDHFVFGYGLDYRGYWRNAPGIFAFKG
jgi:hypoxanthine phosphoribosyltransferase